MFINKYIKDNIVQKNTELFSVCDTNEDVLDDSYETKNIIFSEVVNTIKDTFCKLVPSTVVYNRPECYDKNYLSENQEKTMQQSRSFSIDVTAHIDSTTVHTYLILYSYEFICVTGIISKLRTLDKLLCDIAYRAQSIDLPSESDNSIIITPKGENDVELSSIMSDGKCIKFHSCIHSYLKSNISIIDYANACIQEEATAIKYRERRLLYDASFVVENLLGFDVDDRLNIYCRTTDNNVSLRIVHNHACKINNCVDIINKADISMVCDTRVNEKGLLHICNALKTSLGHNIEAKYCKYPMNMYTSECIVFSFVNKPILYIMDIKEVMTVLAVKKVCMTVLLNFLHTYFNTSSHSKTHAYVNISGISTYEYSENRTYNIQNITFSKDLGKYILRLGNIDSDTYYNNETQEILTKPDLFSNSTVMLTLEEILDMCVDISKFNKYLDTCSKYECNKVVMNNVQYNVYRDLQYSNPESIITTNEEIITPSRELLGKLSVYK